MASTLRCVAATMPRSVRVAPSISRPTIARTVQRPLLQHVVRFQSTGSNASVEDKERLKAARKLKDELQRDWTAPILSYEQVKPKTESPSPDAYLIDVREPDEVLQGSIPSSINVPLSVLSSDLHLTVQAFREKYGFDKPGKAQEIVFYCRSGKRSASAADVAKRNGYTNIFNYEGSWLDWVKREGKKAD